MDRLYPFLRALPLCAAATLALAPRAVAHAGEHLREGALLDGVGLWSAWTFEPEIALGIVVVLWIYVRGAWRRLKARRPVPVWRHLVFVSGVAIVGVALESPIDFMAEHSFTAHQIQHMLLRIAGPLCIMLAAPQGALVAGLPMALRRGALTPVLYAPGLRTVFGGLMSPPAVFAIFVASLYVWQIPYLHDTAILNDGVHYLMHATMLIAGLMFWAVLFDLRAPPKGVSHRVRQVMLLGTIVANMALGAFTTLKTVALYPAYDVVGRLFDMAPLPDEAGGGFLIWAPSSMMSLIAIMFVFNLWNRAEELRQQRHWSWTGSNAAALEFPETAEELWIAVAAKNRRTARALATLSVSMFVLVFCAATLATMLR